MADQSPCVKCFGSLGIDSRMKIYKFLKENGKSTVSSIVDILELTQPTVSYHLKEMKDAGLLNSSKSGKEVFYSVNQKCPSNNIPDCFLAKTKF
ncbi:MAG TPA: metalloregulator ArsR/SmtB family transcription factor [Candidatus Colwellbacteria bacterium]|nr:metalloregulator ArsR/SmtB family transcription factor [Candidatus Colwellbacteria bacterium]